MSVGAMKDENLKVIFVFSTSRPVSVTKTDSDSRRLVTHRPSIKNGVFAIEEPIGLWGTFSVRIQLFDPILGTHVE